MHAGQGVVVVEREEKIARHMFVHLLKEETGICTLQDGPLKPSFLLQQLNHCVAFQCSRQQNKVNIRMECPTIFFSFSCYLASKVSEQPAVTHQHVLLEGREMKRKIPARLIVHLVAGVSLVGWLVGWSVGCKGCNAL